MENASKALIIAGAILLSIIIVTLGIVIVNNARTSINNANLSEAEVTAFNSQFTIYTGTSNYGTSITGQQLLDLIEKVRVSNELEKQNKSGKYVCMTGDYVSTAGEETHFTKWGDGSTEGDGKNNWEGIDDWQPSTSTLRRYKVKPYFSVKSRLLWKIEVTIL